MNAPKVVDLTDPDNVQHMGRHATNVVDRIILKCRLGDGTHMVDGHQSEEDQEGCCTKDGEEVDGSWNGT